MPPIAWPDPVGREDGAPGRMETVWISDGLAHGTDGDAALARAADRAAL